MSSAAATLALVGVTASKVAADGAATLGALALLAVASMAAEAARRRRR